MILRCGYTLLFVLLAAVLPYLSTIHNYFQGDDFGFVPLLATKPSWHFLTLFTRSWAPDVFGFPLDELRPFTAISFQLGSLFGGGEPAAQHAINLAIHAVNALLVAGLAMVAARLPRARAAFAGIFFAVLPLHVEPVAWITGRTESLNALFCLLALLTWAAWRRTQNGLLYVGALASVFAALFSKQNALVMLAVLVAYDLLVERASGWRGARSRWRDYVPVALLTLGYLWLRHLVFSNAIRGGSIDVKAVQDFLLYQAMYVVMLFSGNSLMVRDHFQPAILTAAAVAAPLLVCCVVLIRSSARRLAAYRNRLLYFGPVWWALTTAPLLVAGYATTRHLYFTLAGVAIVLGLLLDLARQAPQPSVRVGGVLAGACLVTCSVLRLHAGVADWNAAARISHKILRDVEHQAAAAPPGTLLLLDAPAVFVTPALPVGRAIGRPWIWSYAIPYSVQPPFAGQNLRDRVDFIVTPRAYCCTVDQWTGETAATAKRWAERSSASAVRVLQWNATTGELRAWGDSNAVLATKVRQLGEAKDAVTMNRRLREIFAREQNE